MEVTLTEDEAVDLRQLLEETISDMSMEIADTDNSQYRATLRARRERLAAIRAKLESASG